MWAQDVFALFSINMCESIPFSRFECINQTPRATINLIRYKGISELSVTPSPLPVLWYHTCNSSSFQQDATMVS